MLSGISFPEVLPLGLPEERPFGPKYMPLSEFECGDMSPRVSTGPSACSMASRYVHAFINLFQQWLSQSRLLLNLSDHSYPRIYFYSCSSSEVEGINDLFSFPLAQGSKPTIIAADHDQSLLLKQHQRYLCGH